MHGLCVGYNTCEYNAMICSLYEIRQKEGESVEEHMLQIHEAITVIHHAYPDQVTDQGKNLAQDQLYHGLVSSLWDALEFLMVELLEREQAGASFDMFYTLAKKMKLGQPTHMHGGGKGFLVPIEISAGDTLLPQDGLQHSLRKSCSCLTLNLWIIRHLSWISLRA